MQPARILVAEDETSIRQGLIDVLEGEGYRVVAVRDGAEALARYERGGFDLILLDVMMPKRSGYDVCRAIRSTDPRVPVLMVTAKGEEIDKVVGLELGADDYITKPFGVRELLARVAAALRRVRGAPVSSGDDRSIPDTFPMAGCVVDRRALRLTRDGEVFDLTPRELALLECFYRRPGEVLSRTMLLDELWGVTYQGTTRTLDQHMVQLRRKIECAPSEPRYLTTVHGVGYRYEPTG